jgi:hypothetical protein
MRIVTASGAGVTNPSRVLTPDPKEAAFWTGGAGSITLDLGAVTSIDTVFAGYTGPVAMDVATSTDGNSFAALPGATLRADDIPPDLFAPIYHAVAIASAPVSARYVRIGGNFPANTPLGVVAVGRAFVSTWGHEWGAGRPIEDTGTAERLIGGGFGIEEGVRVGGYQWTFGDLTDDEVRALYAIGRDRGSTRSVLVVEDPDRTAGIHERIHWGLARFDTYERLAANATRYGLAIRDWA